jgi:hypothetical protein
MFKGLQYLVTYCCAGRVKLTIMIVYYYPYTESLFFIAAPNTATFPIENMHLSGHPLTAAELRKTKKHSVVTNSRCERHVACDLLAIQM